MTKQKAGVSDPDLLGLPSLELSDASARQLTELVTETLGIRMNESKLPLLQGRLQRRLRELGLDSLEGYRNLLFSAEGGEEIRHFIDAVTTNKTDFFREPRHFEILMGKVLPQLSAVEMRGHSRSWRMKLWSAPCSSGEEPYTLAMLLQDHAARTPGFDYAILGTDISTRMLEHARRGVYTSERVQPVPPDMRARYLMRARDRSRDELRVTPELRSRTTFRILNFMDDHYRVTDTFDVIFCRNVLIYFEKDVQEAVVRKLARHLRRDGFLFIGHSESLAGLDVPFAPYAVAVYRHQGRSGASGD